MTIKLLTCFLIVKIINSCNIADIDLSSLSNEQFSCNYYLDGIVYQIFYTPDANNLICNGASYQVIQTKENECFYLSTMYDIPAINCNINVYGNKGYQISYYNGQYSNICNNNRKTNIVFICDKDATPYNPNMLCDETAPCEYTLYIKTTNACYTGLSAGWLLVIFFFIILFMYCIVGYLWNVTRTAEWGNCKQNIPHYNLWYSLPFAVCAGCKVSYMFIKQRCCSKQLPQYGEKTLDDDLLD